MTKYVAVTIEGHQLGTDEAPIVLTGNGTYHLHNDKHYIQYDEVSGDGKGSSKNIIKVSQTQLEMLKKGTDASQITFDANEITQALYHTPYGSLGFEVRTSDITAKESEELIEVKLEYALFAEETHLSDHKTIIRVVPDRSIT